MESKEHHSDQSSAEGSKITGNGATLVSAACKPKHKNRLRRHRSMENLPAELKSTQDCTISIFLEYVRNRSVTQKETEKQTMNCDNFEASALDSDIEFTPLAQQRASQCIRRLQSEPNGDLDSQVRVVNSTSELKDQPLCSTAKTSRPFTLSLSPANAPDSGANKASKQSPPKHKRMLSNSGADVPDPPLFSPGCVSERLEATYPPGTASRCRSSPSPMPLPQYDWQRHQIGCASFGQLEFSGLSKHNARTIAERLKVIGDKLEQEHGEERLSNIVNSCMYSQPITITRFLRVLSNLKSRLNWQKVSELFVLGYRLLEIMTQVTTKPYEDERWWLFENLWYFLVNTVARWVMENGGWEAFLRATDSFEGDSNCHHRGRSPDSPRAARTRLWSLSESGSIVDEDGVSLLDTITGNEGSVMCSHTHSDRESSSHALFNDQVLAADSEVQVSSTGLLGSTSPLEQELLDSGIVSSTELPQDEEGHGLVEDQLTSSCVLSESLQDLDDYELQESDTLVAAGTDTSLDDSNSEPLPFDRNRSRSLPIRSRGARPNMPRRASERALDGLLYTVNIGVSAAFVYAVVSSLLNK